MWWYILIYFVIGLFISLINNHIWSKLETPEEKNSDNPGMILALILWIIFWPLGLTGTIIMTIELLKNKE